MAREKSITVSNGVMRTKNGKWRKSDIVVETLLILFFIIVCIVILYPILNVLAVSLSSDGHVLRGDVTFYPKDLTFAAYKAVLANKQILRAFGNSIYIAVVGCVLGLIATLFAAYPIACCDFPGKKLYTIFVLIPMWFSAGMIPSYLCISKLGLVNTYWSLIFSSLIVPYNVLILSSFLKGLPKEVLESARIDGAGELRIMFQIILPLSKASLATIGLWVIAGHWNAYMEPLMYISDFNKFTLQQVLQDIVLNADAVKYELGNATTANVTGAALADQLKNAVLIVSMIPMLIVYPFIQKYFVKGVTLGAVKG